MRIGCSKMARSSAVRRRDTSCGSASRGRRAPFPPHRPHICILYDIGRQDDIDFLVMEYLEGETLEARFRKGPLPLSQFFEIAIQVGETLEQAHQASLVHRDRKPAHIMLTRTGAKLARFRADQSERSRGVGACRTQRHAYPDHALTQKGTIVGTFQYMAPEHLEGQEAGSRSDIFAFGAVMYEMATGAKLSRAGATLR